MPCYKGNNEWVGVSVHKHSFYAHRGVNTKEISSQAAIQEKKSCHCQGCSVCLKHLDLCSGIGGFALGLQKTGYFKTIGFCEIDPFCQKVLKKNFPGVPIYSDIKKFKPNDEGLRPDVITSGFPCQPFSTAGRQKGKDDNRNLWKETLRIIKECRPSFFVGENVNGIVKLYLDTILEDLESEGYSVRCFNISASSIGASHQRARIWIVANSSELRGQNLSGSHAKNGQEKLRQENVQPINKNTNDSNSVSTGTQGNKEMEKESSQRLDGSDVQSRETFTDSLCEGLQGCRLSIDLEKEQRQVSTKNSSKEQQNWWEAESKLRGIPDGIQYGLHKDRGKRIMALGNAVCPQIPFLIGKAIGKLYE